jgi:hypothetical protein
MKSLNSYWLTAEISNVSTAGQVYVVIPDGGYVTNVWSALGGAITGADADLTVKVNGASVGTITIANSGSAAGDVDSLALVRSATNYTAGGSVIEIETDGASTNAVPVVLTIEVTR